MDFCCGSRLHAALTHFNVYSLKVIMHWSEHRHASMHRNAIFLWYNECQCVYTYEIHTRTHSLSGLVEIVREL